MAQVTYTKDPSAVLDYGFDWRAWLESAGNDTIDTSTWTVDTGLTVNASTVSGGVSVVWLSGGTVGVNYTVTNRIVTAGGRTDERSLTVLVRQR